MPTSFYDLLVVGAGPAGASAALEAATRGARVLLVEQRPQAGGAIHRAAYDGGPSAVPMPARHKRNWAALRQGLAGMSDRIRLLTSAVFLGIDGDGVCMIDGRAAGRVWLARPRGVIFATGATERVPPVPGWELPGVVTAGGLQVQMKESGQAPRGRILVAGNGPLPLALGAQLAALGNAPVAVLEAAALYRNLWARPGAALGLLAGPRQLLEAAGYFRALRAAGVPYRMGTTVSAVSVVGAGNASSAGNAGNASNAGDASSASDASNASSAGSAGSTRDAGGPDNPGNAGNAGNAADAGLRVRTRDRRGQARDYEVDLLVLHGGLACNDRGIPAGDMHGIVIARAGDCNQVLGADAALTEGRRVAAMVMRRLDEASRPGRTASGASASGASAPTDGSRTRAAEAHPQGAAVAFQKSIRRLFDPASVPASPPAASGAASASAAASTSAAAAVTSASASALAAAPAAADMDTVICRCEGVTRRALADQDLHSAREVRLVGRIGMGLCQGRFCAHAASMAVEHMPAGANTPPMATGLTLADIDGPIPRWPIRPVSVKALADAEDLQ